MLSGWENFEWEHPWRLAFILLPAILLYVRMRYPGFNMLRFEATGISKAQIRRTWRGILLASSPWLLGVASLFLILAWAGPRLALAEEKITAEGIDIFMAMDLSSSMLARDFEPDRLAVSKEMAARFVDKRIHDRIGLTVFAGEAFTQCPLTTDHAIVKEFLSQLQCGQLEDGTAIGMGLASAVNRLKDSETKTKIIILITDGVNNAGYIQPMTAAEIAKSLGIRIYAIGVGSMGEALTPVRRTMDGKYLFGMARVEIDEALMRQITEMTGGKYFRATSEEILLSVYDEINKLEKTKMNVTVIKRYKEGFRPLLLMGLLLIGLDFLIRFVVVRQAGF